MGYMTAILAYSASRATRVAQESRSVASAQLTSLGRLVPRSPNLKVLQPYCNRVRTEVNGAVKRRRRRFQESPNKGSFQTGRNPAGNPRPNLQGGGRWFDRASPTSRILAK